LPYLSGVRCTFCTDSPWYSWSKSIQTAQIQRALAAQLNGTGPIDSVQLQQPDGSGRPRTWTFVGPGGAIDVTAKDVRRSLGARVLPSLLVHRAAIDDVQLTIDGGGLGHGVGLCQWGARGMALRGAASSAILQQYFPGTVAAGD